jgi:hypothetical protein
METKLYISLAIKRLNVENSYCNCKKTKTTSDAKPTICISSTNEMKTQVRWAVVIGQKA